MLSILTNAADRLPSASTPHSIKAPFDESSWLDADGKLGTINGYCLVALTVEGKPVKTRSDCRATYRGRTYYFSSPSAVREFEETPSIFIPAHDGFDVAIVHRRGALIRGRLEHGIWCQHKLYLFESAETKEQAIRLGLVGDGVVRDSRPQINQVKEQRVARKIAPPGLFEQESDVPTLPIPMVSDIVPDTNTISTNDDESDAESPAPIVPDIPLSEPAVDDDNTLIPFGNGSAPEIQLPLMPEPRRLDTNDVLPSTSAITRPRLHYQSVPKTVAYAPSAVTSATTKRSTVPSATPRNPDASRYWCRIYLKSTIPQPRRDVQVKLTFPPQEYVVAGRGPTKCTKKGQSVIFDAIKQVKMSEREYFEILIDAHHPDHGKLVVDIEEKTRTSSDTAGRNWQVDVEFLPVKHDATGVPK